MNWFRAFLYTCADTASASFVPTVLGSNRSWRFCTLVCCQKCRSHNALQMRVCKCGTSWNKYNTFQGRIILGRVFIIMISDAALGLLCRMPLCCLKYLCVNRPDIRQLKCHCIVQCNVEIVTHFNRTYKLVNLIKPLVCCKVICTVWF